MTAGLRSRTTAAMREQRTHDQDVAGLGRLDRGRNLGRGRNEYLDRTGRCGMARRKLARHLFAAMSRWQAKLERKQSFLGRVVEISNSSLKGAAALQQSAVRVLSPAGVRDGSAGAALDYDVEAGLREGRNDRRDQQDEPQDRRPHAPTVRSA